MAGEKILNIDDSPTVQRLIEMILSAQGYQVVLAQDGEAGIAMAKAEKPAVILVDFVMPKMNGFQVCKALKEDPEFNNTPIILVTSKGDTVGSKFVDVLGITEYFTKPFQPEELLAKIREVIDKAQAAAAPSAPPREEASRPAPAPRQVTTQPPSSDLERMVRQIVQKALDEFISKSLPELIRRELTKAPPEAQPETQFGIKGNIASFRTVEVMQMLGLQRQTGRLALSRNGEGADIYFRDGAIIFATSACSGGKVDVEGLLKKTCRLDDNSIRHALRVADTTGQPIDDILARERMVDSRTFADNLRRHTESTVYKTMAWSEGNFIFEKKTAPVVATSMQLKVDDLLLEGARRADEWTLIEQKIPNFGMVFEAMIGNAEELTTRGMSDIDLKAFSLINGKNTVQDIIDMSCLSEFDVAKSMFILLSVNLIRTKK